MPELDIVRQTGLVDRDVREALTYLTERQYLQRTTDEMYVLHPKVTVGRLLVDSSHVRLLFELEALANSEAHFTLTQVGKKLRHRSSRFVREALLHLLAGAYVESDPSREKGHFLLNTYMLDDEREYLTCWVRHKGALPSRVGRAGSRAT